MQRRNLIIGGSLLALLLLGVVAVVAFVIPGHDTAPQTGPAQPTNAAQGPVKAEPGDTVVMLTWEPVAGAAGYAIYRDGGSAPLNPAPLTTTKFEDIGLSNGRSYTYTVAILNASGKPGARLPEIAVAPKSK